MKFTMVMVHDRQGLSGMIKEVNTFGAPNELERNTKQVGGPVTHLWVEGGGHDFKHHGDEVADEIGQWLRSLGGRGSR